jgi:5'-deoxynucleotidase YfbR-like HD superfamily hydrolase
LAGIADPESVAEHSLRVAIVGIALAALEGADVGRTAALFVAHDAPETRTGDIPAVRRAYVTTA